MHADRSIKYYLVPNRVQYWEKNKLSDFGSYKMNPATGPATNSNEMLKEIISWGKVLEGTRLNSTKEKKKKKKKKK